MDRAVSDVIAFVLVFSVIITSVALVYGFGFGAIADLQETEQSHSGERAFQALAVGIEDVQRDRGPNRAMDIDSAGRSLLLHDEPTINVTIDTGSETEYVTASGALVYGEGQDTEIAYASGAVIRQDETGLLTRDPSFRCLDERATISLIDFSGDEGVRSPTGTIRVIAEQQNTDESRLAFGPEEVDEINVTVENPRYEGAWVRYFEENWDDAEVTADGHVRGTCDVDGSERSVVRVIEIDLEFVT